MKSKRKTAKKKTYRSFAEFEKTFFPNAYEEEISESRNKEPKEFGTGLAIELLEGIKQKLK